MNERMNINIQKRAKKNLELKSNINLEKEY